MWVGNWWLSGELWHLSQAKVRYLEPVRFYESGKLVEISTARWCFDLEFLGKQDKNGLFDL